MASFSSRPWIAPESVPYREILNAPGIGRAHDVQRLVSYGLGVAVGIMLDLPAWRAVSVIALSALLFLGALLRLTTRMSATPYRLAQLDLVVASLIVAVATASPLISAAVAIVISIAVAATFEAPPRVAAFTGAATTTTAAVVAAAVAEWSTDSGSDYLEALVLIVLLLAIALLILGFFTVQARQLRRALNRRESQLNAVLDVTPVLLASIDKDGDVTNLAGDVESWLATNEDDPKNVGVGGLFAAVARGETVTEEVTVDQRVFTVTSEPDAHGTGLLTAFDITEQIEARRRLEGLVRSKDQFIAAVSHELRTPLSSVLGFAELIRDGIDHADPLSSMITEVVDQSAEMAAVIDDLLVAARSSFEAIPTAPRRINLAAEAAAVAESIGARLTKTVHSDLLPVPAHADPIRVRQIIRNLLTNADRYGGNQVRLVSLGAGSRAILQVRDNGDPLAAEMRDRIFEPYESSGPVRGQPAAIGLGLAVSRTLAELMGGSLRYEHASGWSSFVLELPQAAGHVTLDSPESARRPGAAAVTGP